MAKISELSDGGSLQSTDFLIAVRSGGNVKVQADGNLSLGTVTADGLTVDGVANFNANNINYTGSSPKINFFENDTTDRNTRIESSGSLFSVKTLTDDAATATKRFEINHSTGDISFYEDTGTTAKFFWDASAESLGIGVSSPTGLLTLGTGTFSAAAANTSALYTSTTAGLVAVADGFLLVDRAGADVFKVDTSGNVGIGVTPSAWSTVTALQVGNAHVGALVDNAYFGANCYYDGSNWRYIATNEASRVELTSGEVQFWNAPSGTAGSVLSQTQAMTLDATGKLLVGTSSNLSGRIVSKGLADGSIFTLVSDQSAFGTGTVGHISFRNSNGAVGSIQTTGSATAYNTSSDQRLKENIVDAPSASDEIDAIQVRSFDWKADGSHQKYGMIAQELQVVVPDAVSAPEDPEEMMSVDYSKLVPMMIKEIQSLRTRIAQLEGAN